MGFLPDWFAAVGIVLAGTALAFSLASWRLFRKRNSTRLRAAAMAVATGCAVLLLGAVLTPYAVRALGL